MRHEFFEELDAFDPAWQSHYRSLAAAAHAAGIDDLFRSWLQTPEGISYLNRHQDVFDYQTAIEEAQKAEEESSLPYKFSTFSGIPKGSFK